MPNGSLVLAGTDARLNRMNDGDIRLRQSLVTRVLRITQPIQATFLFSHKNRQSRDGC